MSQSRSATMPPLFPLLYFLVILPLLQVGTGYYSSVAAAGTILVVLRFHRVLLFNRYGFLRAVTAGLMLLSYASSPIDDNQIFLRVFRETLLFFVISGLIYDPLAMRPSQALSVNILALAFTSVLTLFVLSQAGLLPIGRISFPNEWFYVEDRTLPTDLTFIFSTVVRPYGFYSEPSYAALVLLSVILVVQPTFKLFLVSRITLVMATMSIVLTQSASGIIFAALLILLQFVHSNLVSPIARLMVLLAVVFGIVVLWQTNISPLNRLGNISNETGENSGFTRLVAPLFAIYEVMSRSLFGLPLSYLANSAVPTGTDEPWAEVIHNGFFNFFIEFGLSGFLIFACFVAACKDQMIRIFLVAFLMQNGGPLSIDKCVLIVMTAALYNSQKVARDVLDFQTSRVGSVAARPSVMVSEAGDSSA
jgi:O-Antigen ligase